MRPLKMLCRLAIVTCRKRLATQHEVHKIEYSWLKKAPIRALYTDAKVSDFVQCIMSCASDRLRHSQYQMAARSL
jgi:hypothetical protein